MGALPMQGAWYQAQFQHRMDFDWELQWPARHVQPNASRSRGLRLAVCAE